MDEHMLDFLVWILLVSISPVAFLLLILMASLKLLQFLCKALLLLLIVAVNTPFAVMCNVSILLIWYKLPHIFDSNATFRRDWFDPRANLGIEVQLIVSDFFKVVAGELLLVLSTGIITFYTAPRPVFYISTVVWMVAIFHKWLNTRSLSKTALSCLCDGYGLSPMMFLFSFIGFFDIGCHPIAKCSFAANTAFLFVKDGEIVQHPFRSSDLEKSNLGKPPIKFLKWDAFERGLFQLNPKIDFIKRNNGKYILKTFMVLSVFHKVDLCEYPVERLELPEDYTKANELYNFLHDLSIEDGFVTDKMRGRYELCLTLSEIAEGVEENAGYKIMRPMDAKFVVAGCTKKPQY